MSYFIEQIPQFHRSFCGRHMLIIPVDRFHFAVDVYDYRICLKRRHAGIVPWLVIIGVLKYVDRLHIRIDAVHFRVCQRKIGRDRRVRDHILYKFTGYRVDLVPRRDAEIENEFEAPVGGKTFLRSSEIHSFI